MEDDKLIGIDMWVNRHEASDGGGHGGAAPTGFSSGIPQTGGVAERAKRADVADRANEADHANTADESNHAKTSDEAETAKTATEADHAKSADEASHAKTADDINLESKTLSHFLRKDIQDTAVDVLTFLKGIIAKAVSYFKGIFNDGDITNTGTITTKNLNVTGKATFFELMIQITKAAGGMTVYSPGAFHIDAVEDKGNYFACFQRAEKDGVKLRQMCDVDDQLMCARFNIDGNGNKFYWMRVSYISSNTVQHVVDGKLVDCLEVRLDKSPKADNCQGEPEVGDALAVFGNRTKEDRQSVIVISAYNSFDIDLRAPYIAQYENVNDFNLKSKKTTWLSKGDNNVTGSFTVVSGGKKVSLDDFVTKISQATFKVEADKITARIDGVEKTLRDTTEKYSELQVTLNSISSTVARKSDLEYVRTEIKQTAEEINLSVENGTRPNLLWGSDLNLDGVDITDKAAIQKHLGVGIASTKIDSTEWFEYLKGRGVSGADAIKFKTLAGVSEYPGLFWEKQTGAKSNIKLKQHTTYTLSAWVKVEFDVKADGYVGFGFEAFKNEDSMSGRKPNNASRLNFSENPAFSNPTDGWIRFERTFTTDDLDYGSVTMNIYGTKPATLYLCRPKLEEGKTATPWCAYDGTVEALLASGFSLKDKEFTATSDNFKVQNNKGEQTFFVDEKGRINNGMLVSKLRLTEPTIITNENYREFCYNGKINGHDVLFLDLLKCGTLLVLKDVGEQLYLDLPSFKYFESYNDNSLEEKAKAQYDKMRYIGNTIILYNIQSQIVFVSGTLKYKRMAGVQDMNYLDEFGFYTKEMLPCRGAELACFECKFGITRPEGNQEWFNRQAGVFWEYCYVTIR